MHDTSRDLVRGGGRGKKTKGNVPKQPLATVRYSINIHPEIGKLVARIRVLNIQIGRVPTFSVVSECYFCEVHSVH